MEPNYIVAPGLKRNSRIFIFDEYRYSFHRKLTEGRKRLRCTNYKNGCRGAAILSADAMTISPTTAHLPDEDRTFIVRAKFREDLRKSVEATPGSLRTKYDDLVALYELTVHPNIAELVPWSTISSSFYTFVADQAARDNECPVCLGPKTPQFLIVGCGHTFCETCARSLQSTSKRCGVCRGNFVDINQVF